MRGMGKRGEYGTTRHSAAQRRKVSLTMAVAVNRKLPSEGIRKAYGAATLPAHVRADRLTRGCHRCGRFVTMAPGPPPTTRQKSA